MRTEARNLQLRRFPASRYVVLFVLAAAGLFADLYSKHVVFEDLGFPAGMPAGEQIPGGHQVFATPNAFLHGQSVPYMDGWVTFRFWTSFNHGALWGVGQGFSWLFATLSVLAVGFVLYWLFVHGAARSLWLTTSLGLITAGTLGNLYDRMALHGYAHPVTGEPWHAVRDFLLFTFGGWPWPVFNFADVFLVTGAIMLVLQSLFSADEPATDAAVTTVRTGNESLKPTA